MIELIGARSVGIDFTGSFDDDSNVFPLTGQLRLVTNDQIVFHRLADGIQSELDGRVFDSTNEARSSPAGITISVGFTDLELGPIGNASIFGLVDFVVEQSSEVALLWLRASASSDMRSAFALTSQQIAVVVIGASRVTLASLAAITSLRQAPVFRQTLVAVTPSHVAFADAFATVDVATLIFVSAQQITAAHLATVWVLFGEVPVSVLALVATATFHETFAVTLTGLDATRRIRASIADAIIQ